MGFDGARGDSEAILERRRLLIAAAASAIGCGAGVKEPASPPAPPPLVTRSPEQPRTPWSVLVELAPPLAYPRDLDAEEREPLDEVCAELAGYYEALRAAYESMPPLCDVRDPRCSERWERVARALKRAEAVTLRDFRPFGIDEAAPHLARFEDNHVRFLARLRAQVKEEVDRQIGTTGSASMNAWLGMRTSRSGPAPAPWPCLSVPAEPIRVFRDGLPFASGSSDFTIGAYTLSRWAKGTVARREHLVVHGHSDVTERDPQELSEARARAVHGVLVEAGIDESRLRIVGFGASMPIATSKTAEGLAENRLAWVKSVIV